MSAGNFDTSLNLTLVYEGGWVDNPKDPGGATYRGITQAVYDAYRGSRGATRQSVRLMSDDELWWIYRQRYWNGIAGDQLALGLDYAVFDFAVNSGMARAARTLQGLVAVAADGNIGPKTLQAVSVHCATYGVTALTDGLCNARMNFLRMLPTYSEFGLGWQRRVMGALPGHQQGDSGVIDRAYAMAVGDAVTAPTAPLTTIKTYNAPQLGAAA